MQVRAIPAASGPDRTVHACPNCAPHVPPGPTPDELLPDPRAAL